MDKITVTIDRTEVYTLLIALGVFEDILAECERDNASLAAMQPSLLKTTKSIADQIGSQLNSEAN